MIPLSTRGRYGYTISRTSGFAAGGYTVSMNTGHSGNTYLLSVSVQCGGIFKVFESNRTNSTFPIEVYNFSSVLIDTIVHFCVYT